ncbi:MAG TPA: FAD-binding and (Fe-S)-binding domain-containing protein [Gemmatimonadaceae bacterium]|nr:FAD-binding and (Fe-S)-binding domain-containing protein [Gemmatimonadaceae bacterium]
MGAASELQRHPAPPRRDAVNRSDVDRAALAAALRSRIAGEVRFSDGDRALYATDASNYRQVPIGVVLPRSADDVIATVATAREFGAPILMRGGGTSLAGQTCNVAVVIDNSKYYNRILEIDPERRIARVEPGLVLDDLRDAAKTYGLTYGPDPATHNRCTLGGMLGNNSCGVHSVMAEFYGYGPMTVDQVESLEVLTYDGERFTVGATSDEEYEQILNAGGRRAEIYRKLRDLRDRYPDEIRRRYDRGLLRRASGYNLNQLLPECGFHVARALVGTEGNCVAILSATVRLMPAMDCRALLALGYPDSISAAADVPFIRQLRPVAIEGMDHELVEQMKKSNIHPRDVQLLPEGRSWLVVEFGAESQDEADARARDAVQRIRARDNAPHVKEFDKKAEEHKLWEVREAGLAATAFIPGKPSAWPGWEDSAVPVDRLADYLRDLRALMDRHGYDASLYGHFGQGLVHCRLNFDLETEHGIENFRAFMREAAELATQKYGGTLSGEHGDGQARGEFLPIMYGETMVRAFREFHDIWDPRDGMNPNKTIAGYTCTENLRLGLDYRPPQPHTEFDYPDDHHRFSHATLRCVGVGMCRRHEGGTMCPSYMVTRDEKHATRGRARLLFEMMQHGPIQDGWKSEEVKSSLDLCLACKGCKGDCPVHVDVATYKAEFLSHYYHGRLRPRHAYAFGLIHWWADLAMRAPHLVNFVTHAPGLSAIAKRAAGMAPERTIPRFAPRTFSSWFRATRGTSAHDDAQKRVILWPDTFNDHFYPETLAAAVDAIESAGWTVVLPNAGLCCGRPLYDYGMLDQARRQLRSILGALRDEIAAGTPVVGLEPSCVSVFRDELTQMLPGNEDARRLSQSTVMFAEFMADRIQDGWRAPAGLAGRAALLHGHCHEKAVLKMQGVDALLDSMKLNYNALNSGCCGMAGAFGFERDKYDVSIAAGERVLLPQVRQAPDAAVVIADGFSCRQQIEQTTSRRALHLAEVVQLAAHADAVGLDGQRPESIAPRLWPRALRQASWTGLERGALVAGAAAAGAVAVRRARREAAVNRAPPVSP